MTAAVTLMRDRSMLVAPEESVGTAWIDIDLCVLGCRDRMAVGDVGDKWRELLQRGANAGWPPPRGSWRQDGRFVIEDGRHEYIAALMMGQERLFVAWLAQTERATA